MALREPVEEFTDLAPGAAPPQVFVRAFSIPAGLPWVQQRAAAMEARHGSPLPVAQLMHQVRRLSSWSPGQTGRFAAFYVRSAEFRTPFETQVEVDGATVRVAFGRGAEHLRQARLIAIAAGLAAATALVLSVSLMTALKVHAQLDGRIEADEEIAAARLHAARLWRQRHDAVTHLGPAVGDARPVDQVLTDLGWVAASMAPEARIVAFHWDHGLIALETRGEDSPVTSTERRIERSDRPLRPGVWLWGIAPVQASPRAPAGTPTAAGLKP